MSSVFSIPTMFPTWWDPGRRSEKSKHEKAVSIDFNFDASSFRYLESFWEIWYKMSLRWEMTSP